MKKTTLAQFAKKHGQVRAAKLLGLSQGSLNKALQVGRRVFVWKSNEEYIAEEVRAFPSAGHRKSKVAADEVADAIAQN